jgi:hypothetical protein
VAVLATSGLMAGATVETFSRSGAFPGSLEADWTEDDRVAQPDNAIIANPIE